MPPIGVEIPVSRFASCFPLSFVRLALLIFILRTGCSIAWIRLFGTSSILSVRKSHSSDEQEPEECECEPTPLMREQIKDKHRHYCGKIEQSELEQCPQTVPDGPDQPDEVVFDTYGCFDNPPASLFKKFDESVKELRDDGIKGVRKTAHAFDQCLKS